MASKIDLENLQSNYFTFCKPIDFNGLKLHYVKVRDWIDFASCVQILDLDKNESGDIEIIQMSYLKWFLLNCMYNEGFGSFALPKLFKLLSICFNTTDINFDLNEDKDFKPSWIINGKALNQKDFDLFKKIIMYQNIPNYEDEEGMDTDYKQAMREYYDLKAKNIEFPSLERQIVIMANERHVMEESIYDMPYRKFRMGIEEMKAKYDWQLYKGAELGGMVTFKQEVSDWIYKTKQQEAQGMVDYDAFKDKLESANG